MFGKNRILKPKKGDGSKLDIAEIFSTFQGECIFTGYNSIFIRLGGCNLACSFCDTEFDNFKEMELSEIFAEVDNLTKINGGKQPELAVITGGEPFRQQIGKLCEELLKRGFLVQIETNGTLFQELPAEVTIICSPKNVDGKYFPIRPDLLPKINAFKFLISTHNSKYFDVPEVGQSQYNTIVYLQPLDEYNPEINQKNHEKTLELAKQFGHRVSLQTHKIWGIR